MYTKLCTKLWVALGNLKDDARGVSALEYAILAALIIGVVAAALSSFDLNGIFGTIKDTFDSQVSNGVGSSAG